VPFAVFDGNNCKVEYRYIGQKGTRDTRTNLGVDKRHNTSLGNNDISEEFTQSAK
jgi:hypothetical protein